MSTVREENPLLNDEGVWNTEISGYKIIVHFFSFWKSLCNSSYDVNTAIFQNNKA